MIPARLKLYLLRRSLATAERDRHAIACRAAEEISARDNHIHRLRRKLSATEAQQIMARTSAGVVARIEREAKHLGANP